MTPPYDPEFDDDAEPRGPSRALVGAWMALAAVLGLAAGYVMVAETPAGLDRRTAHTSPVPPVESAPDPNGQDTATASRPLTPEGGVPLQLLRDTTVDPPGGVEPPSEPESAAAPGDEGAPQAPAVPAGAVSDTGGADREDPAASNPDGGAAAGDAAWRDHARAAPEVPSGFDRVAVVVRGLGLNGQVTGRAIDELPGEIALSFSPYGSKLGARMRRAREAGHELFMDLPMQPRSFPVPDTGKRTLKVDDEPARNLERLRAVLNAGTDAMGVVAHRGGAFVERRQAVEPVLEALHERGLIYVANGRSRGDTTGAVADDLGLPHLETRAILDRRPVGRAVVDSWLAAAERMAQESGLALVLVNAYPMTLDALTRWSQTLDARGIALVPVSAALERPAANQAARLR